MEDVVSRTQWKKHKDKWHWDMAQRLAWRKKRKQYEVDQCDLIWTVDGKVSENFILHLSTSLARRISVWVLRFSIQKSKFRILKCKSYQNPWKAKKKGYLKKVEALNSVFMKKAAPSDGGIFKKIFTMRKIQGWKWHPFRMTHYQPYS